MKELKETLNELKEKVNNEEPKDTIVPKWEEMYMGLKEENEELKKALDDAQNTFKSYQQYIQQCEITIRMLSSMMNK